MGNKERVYLTIVASVISILFIVFIHAFPIYSVLLLSVETVLLPTIYIVGNMLIEARIHEGYTAIIEEITRNTAELNHKYYMLKHLYEEQRT